MKYIFSIITISYGMFCVCFADVSVKCFDAISNTSRNLVSHYNSTKNHYTVNGPTPAPCLKIITITGIGTTDLLAKANWSKQQWDAQK